MFQRLNRGGWPYPQPPNAPFEINRASPQAEGLVAWWPTLASAGANVLRDLGGRGHNLTQPVAGKRPAWRSDSEQGHVLDYEHDNGQYFTIPNNADLQTGDIDFTVALWANTESFWGAQVLAAKLEAGPLYEWDLMIFADGQVRFRIWNGAGVEGTADSTTHGPMTLGQWYLIIGWHDAASNIVGIEVNGVGDTAATTDVPSSTLADFTIGAYANDLFGSSYDGKIASTMFWRRVLSPAIRRSLWPPQTRWELHRPRTRRVWVLAPGAPVVGQPMMLRGTTVPGLRQWHPRV